MRRTRRSRSRNRIKKPHPRRPPRGGGTSASLWMTRKKRQRSRLRNSKSATRRDVWFRGKQDSDQRNTARTRDGAAGGSTDSRSADRAAPSQEQTAAGAAQFLGTNDHLGRVVPTIVF